MEYHVYRQGLEQPSCSNSRCSHQCADTYDKITGKVVDASGVFFTSDVCMFILLQNTMCAGKALNNNRTAIRDALIKVFVESALSTPQNNVENKVIASVFGESSMQAVINLSKLIATSFSASNPVKACIWEMMVPIQSEKLHLPPTRTLQQ